MSYIKKSGGFGWRKQKMSVFVPCMYARNITDQVPQVQLLSAKPAENTPFIIWVKHWRSQEMETLRAKMACQACSEGSGHGFAVLQRKYSSTSIEVFCTSLAWSFENFVAFLREWRVNVGNRKLTKYRRARKERPVVWHDCSAALVHLAANA